MTWRTMETAPKDGTRVLLIGPTYEGNVLVATGAWRYDGERDRWEIDGEGPECAWANDYMERPPVAWQPLPEAKLP